MHNCDYTVNSLNLYTNKGRAHNPTTKPIAILLVRYSPPTSARVVSNPPTAVQLKPVQPVKSATSIGTTVVTAARIPLAIAGFPGSIWKSICHRPVRFSSILINKHVNFLSRGDGSQLTTYGRCCILLTLAISRQFYPAQWFRSEAEHAVRTDSAIAFPNCCFRKFSRQNRTQILAFSTP